MSVLPWRRAASPPPLPDLFAALPVPVVALDPADRPLHANLAAESLLNVSAGVLAERGFAGLTIDGAPVSETIAAARAKGGGHASYDVALCLADGRSLRADVLVAPLTDAPGWLVLTLQTRGVASLVDRQLVHRGAARAATGVAAMLAHEIKNPLSGIRGAAQLIAQTAVAAHDTDAQELTALICAEVDRIRDLVDRMEGFTDTRPLLHAPENIHAVLGHVRGLARSGGARIAERYDPSLPLVSGHRDSLVQLFLNLVNNAVEAGGADAEVTITSAYRQGLRIATPKSRTRVALPIEICVIDTGPGAAAHVADHLFDPFVTTKAGGRGLGLALVAKIVDDHGGIVEYERDAEHGRTIFRVLLPTA